jgi:hypothetical protein
VPIDHTPHHAQITVDGFRNLIKRSVPMAEYLGIQIDEIREGMSVLRLL